MRSLNTLLFTGALAILAISCSASPTPNTAPQPQNVVRGERHLMGTHFEIQVVSDHPEHAQHAIEDAFAEVERVEALISEWISSSEISEVIRRAGEGPVVVGPELYAVVEEGKRLSKLTDGAFDLTFASCGHLYSIRQQRVPSQSALNECLPRIDHHHIQLDEKASTIFLDAPGVRIGVGGIGKGYGVDRAAAILEHAGIEHYVVNGGGDIRLRGRRLGRPWRVGIAHPRRARSLLGNIEMTEGAVVSSGDYERYFVRDGVLYHHIIDPHTGRPARLSAAVTVIAPDATRADALSTALFVLGPERGLELVETLPDVEALMVTPDLQMHTSSGFHRAGFTRNPTPGAL